NRASAGPYRSTPDASELTSSFSPSCHRVRLAHQRTPISPSAFVNQWSSSDTHRSKCLLFRIRYSQTSLPLQSLSHLETGTQPTTLVALYSQTPRRKPQPPPHAKRTCASHPR